VHPDQVLVHQHQAVPPVHQPVQAAQVQVVQARREAQEVHQV
tara:strand:+ start:401 stop:526 length:126 start_codon:yes stop_codon:yes gene_type:complete